MSNNFSYCPVCQLPLKAINISPDSHVAKCMTRTYDSDTEECVKGVHCLSTDVFHYRDFTHNILASYRSSSDFVPPEVEIKPSPKKRKTSTTRHLPKKARTPSKCEKERSSDSDSDSSVLLPPKRLCRNSQRSKEINLSSDSDESKVELEHTQGKAIQHILTTDSKFHSESDSIIKITKKDGLDRISDKDRYSKNNSKNTLTVLNESQEVTLEKEHSRSCSSLSSISVTTNTSKNEGSDLDSESTLGSVRSQTINPPPKYLEKEPVITMSRIRSTEDLFSSPSKTVNEKILSLSIKNPGTEEESDTNVSFSKADFEDMIPTSKLDKELLLLKGKTSKSPISSLCCTSEYDNQTNSVSSRLDNVSEDGENLSDTAPSSPEVMIPPKHFQKPAALLTSSTDSDLPLSFLVSKPRDKMKKSRSGIKCKLRNEKNSEVVVGKEKAGKILRTIVKAPTYLNGSSLKSSLREVEISTNSSRESDSGKSSASKNTNSFVPSEKSSSSNWSDSAESTDRLASSSVTSSTSSSKYTSNDHTSDLTYSEGSEDFIASRSNKKHRISPRKDEKWLSPTKHKHLKKHLNLNSESSSSEISMKEKLLFSDTKSSCKSVKNDIQKAPSQSSILSITVNGVDKSGWQSLLAKMRTRCYPSDLKIDSEDSLTVQSSCSSSDTSQSSMGLPGRQCPFYKRIPETPFAVDAFQYGNIPGVKVYFLSHFHSDHYIGLKKSFSSPIYCTRITVTSTKIYNSNVSLTLIKTNLVQMKLRVAEKWLCVLELNKPKIICGVEVTALDANHCPGSVMFLFSLTNGRNYLHVGDFRASRSMTYHPSLRSVTVTKLFLDTTYCNPQYCFPTQEDVIGRVIDAVKEQVRDHPRTLVVCGSYTIGKEKVFLGIAEAMNWRVWARPEKQRVFACLEDSRINSRLVKDFRLANIHVLPMGSIQIKPLQQHLQTCQGVFSHVIGVKPTGWELNNATHNFKVMQNNNIKIYDIVHAAGVPYSEHSSFTELRDFVQFLQPHEVVPTVNVGNAASRTKMTKYFSDWLKSSGGSGISHPTETQKKVSQYFKMSTS